MNKTTIAWARFQGGLAAELADEVERLEQENAALRTQLAEARKRVEELEVKLDQEAMGRLKEFAWLKDERDSALAREARLRISAEAYAEEIQEDCECVNQVALKNFHAALDAPTPATDWLARRDAEVRAKVWEEDADWHKLCASRYDDTDAWKDRKAIHVASEQFSRAKAREGREGA